MKLKIKPTTGGETFEVEVGSASDTIAEVKSSVSSETGATLDTIRLIYKGQILKDDRTVDSYGLQNDHVIHFVKSRPQTTPHSSNVTAPSPLASTSSHPVTSTPTPPFSFPSSAPPPPSLDSPMVEAMLSQPDLLRAMMRANPQVRAMTEANPEIAAALDNPAVIQDMARVMRNPSLMREMTRNMDRAMANLESVPGGFNALRQFHDQVSQPIYDATNGNGNGNGDTTTTSGGGGGGHVSGTTATTAIDGSSDNPFIPLFQQQQGTMGGSGRNNTQAGRAPNEAPLPNPWASSAATTGGGGGGGGPMPSLFSGGGLGAGGIGGVDMENMMNNPEVAAAMERSMASPEMQQAMQQAMSDPNFRSAMQQQMQQLVSTPEGAAELRQSIQSSSMYQQAVAENPGMAGMLTDPSFLSAMLDPGTMQALTQLQQGPLGQIMGGGGGGGGGGVGGGFGGGGMMMGQGGGVPPADPETAYATQLQQLQDMGFYDREACVRALVATNGNVHAAVERLLTMM